MPRQPSAATGSAVRLRVVHFARTSLATAAIARALAIPGVRLHRSDSLDDFLARIPQADLVLLADPGPALAAPICRRIEDVAPRPLAVHLLSAGIEGLARWTVPPHVALSRAGSALAPTVAEHALALVLALRRGLHHLPRGTWTDERTAAGWCSSLEGEHALIVGCGQIGRAVARRLRPFGAHVTGLNRTPGDLAEFDVVAPLDRIDDHLPQAGVVVLCLPLTPGTGGLLDRARLARLRPGAHLVNVGRGGVVDETALAEALASGRIGGAGLDVFATEPLPADSPLWAAPNAILTPHVAGLGGRGEDRIAASVRALAERLLAAGTTTAEGGRQ
jgi:phosphoglycerate dehydrogenase-like enzyme